MLHLSAALLRSTEWKFGFNLKSLNASFKAFFWFSLAWCHFSSLCSHSLHPVVCLLVLGGADDVGQLCPWFQSSHRLDPTSGEVGEDRCPEQVIIISCAWCFSVSLMLCPFGLLPKVKLEVLVSGFESQTESIRSPSFNSKRCMSSLASL